MAGRVRQSRRHPEVRALARLEGWATDNSSFEARRRRLAPQDDDYHLSYDRGGRRRLTALRRGERATRGYNRLAASRRGLTAACGPRANSISIRSASTTERWRTAPRPIAPKRHSRWMIRPSR